MSSYLGRIRRVYTGWIALPGRHLLIFDDCFVRIRASAFDGSGELLDSTELEPQHNSGSHQLADGLTPAELAERHPDNWLLANSDVIGATLGNHLHLAAWRRLTFVTTAQTTTVDYEPGANRDRAVVAVLRQALGDRFSTTKR